MVTKNKKKLILPVLFISVFLMVLTSCKNDDGKKPVVSAKKATMISFRTQTPNGRIYYMGVYPEVPEELSVSKAVELGANQRIYTFGENPYTWNGNASTLTKWKVSKTDLSLTPAAVMSVAGIGISGDLGEPVFISETEAYFFALREGKIIEFKPKDMTITKTHNVSPLKFSGKGSPGWYGVWNKYVRDSKVIMPVGYQPGGEWGIPTGAQVAVFDIKSKKLTYQTDNRLLVAAEKAVISNKGDIYLQPAYGADFAVHYGKHKNKPSTMTILKIKKDGTFDPSFSYDFGTVTNTKFLMSVNIIFDNKAIISVADKKYKFPADPATRWNNLNLDNWIVDMEINKVSKFTALDKYNQWHHFQLYDKASNYYIGRINSGSKITTYLLRQNRIDDYTEISKFEGGLILSVAKLW